MDQYYFEITSVVSNFLAVFLAAYIGIKYFVKQQTIVRLEKQFYDDGVFTAEKELLKEADSIFELSNYIAIKFDNLPLKIRNRNVSNDDVEKILIDFKTKLFEYNSTSLKFSPSIIKTASLIKKSSNDSFFIEWIQLHESYRGQYVIEVCRLIDNLVQENINRKDDMEFSNQMIVYLQAVNELFRILMSITPLSAMSSLLREKIIEGTISSKEDILQVLEDDSEDEWVKTTKEFFDEQYRVYEIEGHLYPYRTLKKGLYLKKLSFKIKNLSGEFPVFILSKNEKPMNMESIESRTYSYAEMQSLACACFEDDKMQKRINFVKDYLNVVSRKPFNE